MFGPQYPGVVALAYSPGMATSIFPFPKKLPTPISDTAEIPTKNEIRLIKSTIKERMRRIVDLLFLFCLSKKILTLIQRQLNKRIKVKRRRIDEKISGNDSLFRSPAITDSVIVSVDNSGGKR